jgi:hypothetical protein
MLPSLLFFTDEFARGDDKTAAVRSGESKDAAIRISEAFLMVDVVPPSRALLAASRRRQSPTAPQREPIFQDQAVKAAAVASYNRGVLMVKACAIANWPDKLLFCPNEDRPQGESVGTVPIGVTDEMGDLEQVSTAALRLNGTWRAADYILQVDGERAQANTRLDLPFEWERFLVKAVPADGKVKFAIGAELYQASFNGDELLLTSTAFRGERLLKRTAETH